MRYSAEPKTRKYVKEFGFLSFWQETYPTNTGKN